jgi:hypothetical protein
MPVRKVKAKKKPIKKETKREALLRRLREEVGLAIADLQAIKTRAGSPARQTVTKLVDEIKKIRKARTLASRRACENVLSRYISLGGLLKKQVSRRRRRTVFESYIGRLGIIMFMARIAHEGEFAGIPIEKLSRATLKAKANELRRKTATLRQHSKDVSNFLTNIGH